MTFPSRREAIGGLAGALGGAGLSASLVSAQTPTTRAGDPNAVSILVTEYGATGDGKTDDTEAFLKTLQAAAQAGGTREGGAIAFVPPGRYRLTRPIEIPQNVTLEGTSRAAPARVPGGSILLVDVPPSDNEFPAFFSLRYHATLCGLGITYPQQDDPANIRPFPWCIESNGDNAGIVNCVLNNPYLGVNFASKDGARHYIDGLYGQPLRKGIWIDNCFDIGRVRNVHFWPGWAPIDVAREYMQKHATAFIIGRTDWQYFDACFCIWYRVGFHFTKNEKHGGGNVLLVNTGADIGPTAVKVDAVQEHSGVSFVNGQFMSGIEVAEENTGPVKFTACGFWGIHEHGHMCDTHARLAGRGQISFDNCHFVWWDMEDKGTPAIDADCEGLAVRNCDFLHPGKRHLRLGPNVKSAIVTGNRFRGGARIDAPSSNGFTIGLNSEV